LKVEYKNPNEYSPLALAYIGDSVFDLIVKTIIVAKNNMQAHKYHVEVSRLVKAGAQADYIDRIWPELNETEQDIYKRGRNTKTHSTAKNASVGQYRKATGFETLIGYLYLKQEYDRLFYLVSRIFDQSDENNRERTKIDGIKQ
jgi:ribonuclease-3 family protein